MDFASNLFKNLGSGVGKAFTVGQGDFEFGVLAVEVVLQAVQVAPTFPLAHGQVVEQIVAAGFGARGRHFALGEYPFETFDGELAHIFNGVAVEHDDIHSGEASHGTYVHDVVFCARIAEPCGHQVFYAVNGSGGDGGFLVGLGDAEVEGGEPLVLAGNIDAWLQVGVVDGETLNDFHDNS